MGMTRGLLAGFALALLAGCGPTEEPDANKSIVFHGNADELVVPKAAPANIANVADIAEPAVNLAPDGLSLVLPTGATRQVTFGMPRDAATRAIAAALGGPVEEGDNQECGAGALSFASFRGGLGLYFDGGKFVGWDLDGRDGGQFATAAGIGIGSTRRQLESANAIKVEDSTLGVEFGAGDLSGLLSSRDPDGEITNLWAGTTCISR